MRVTETELRDLLELSYRIAQNAFRNNDPEYLSEAHMALLYALNTYNEEKGTLRAWVRFIVARHLIYFNRKRIPNATEEQLERLRSKRNRVIEAIGELTDDDGNIARLYWIGNLTMEEICQIMNMHVSRLRMIITRIRGELKEAIYG